MPAPPLRTLVLALSVLGPFLAPPTSAAAQSRGVLFGLVVDDANEAPVVGAEVEVVGTNVRARADELGMFVLSDLPAGPQNIRVEKDGYSKVMDRVDVPAGGLADLQVRLVPMAIALEELFVTGQRVRRTGYSVTELETDGDSDRTAADLLAANVPGVWVAVNRGVAGSSADVAIRGRGTFTTRGTPVIYLDGILISEFVTPSNPSGVNALSVLAQIPAKEVERIYVLKGPSAGAQYPQADGAIIIETVRGRPR